ncbi:MAG: hypothetical protein R8K47_03395, partial [Mariprofundaceae bacterium]
MSSMLATSRPVPVFRHDLDRMLAFARLMAGLERSRAWLSLIRDRLPLIVAHDPGMPSMLMGYDFHLTGEGPKLIEINNNAGGLHIGAGAPGGWLPQPAIADLEGDLEGRLRAMFPQAWRAIAIMDEDVRHQFMYPEMLAYAKLLRREGRAVFVVSPEEIVARPGGLDGEGRRLDALYNRHTAVYLES